MRKFFTLLVLALIALTPAMAVEPDELLDDPAMEERAREISKQLRCVVCQSQSIDDSNAPLAKDMRLLVRERLLKGDSDDQVIAFLVERYGDYILLKPPVQSNTIFLWAAPIIIFLLAGVMAVLYLLRMRRLDDEMAD